MFGLKIFVRVQTFRRVPPVLPRNFCHPDSYILPRFHKFLLPVLRGTLGKKNLNNYSGSKLEYKHCKFILFSISSSCVTKIYDGVSLSCNLVLSCNCSCCDCHLVIWGLSERVPVEHCCAINTNKPSILLFIA